MNSPDGREATVRFYGPNSAFGEFSVLDGEPHSASAAAVDEVTTLVLYRAEFMVLLRQHFELVERMFAMLIERLGTITLIGPPGPLDDVLTRAGVR